MDTETSENFSKFMILLIAVIFSITLGYAIASDKLRKEAVEKGHAYWDNNGGKSTVSTFKWIEKETNK